MPTALVHRPIITNNNSNLNTLSGVGNIINNNPIVNIQSSREAFVNYAPVNNFISSGINSVTPDPAQEQVCSAFDRCPAPAHAQITDKHVKGNQVRYKPATAFTVNSDISQL